MKTILCLATLLVSTIALAQDESAEEIRTLIGEHTYAISLENGTLRGPGADLLRGAAVKSHFFLFGEQHATADVPHVASALWNDLNASGYQYLCVEVGPYGTRHLEQMLRARGRDALEEFLREGDNLLTFPFVFFSEELDLLEAVVRDSADPTQALWGVDQEFIAGGRVLLEELESLAETEAQRAAVAGAREAAQANLMWLGTSEPAAFEPLQLAFAEHERGKQIVDAMVLSNRVYAPFTGRGGNVYLANDAREGFMKESFAAAFEAAWQRGGAAPRVFLKLGANHLAAGHSPTHVLSLGTFVRELAQLHGLESYAVHADCQGGLVTDPRSGETSDCDSYFLGESSDLAALLPDEPMALLDLRALRPHLDDLADWDDRSRMLILAYDSVLFVRDVTPATIVGRESN